ncbi:MAG: hypothetical protein A2293_12570 [Elusimicrobia bacterium RIFOXYB2_FULL_49_7]|nr:MAG: hypothetical protein A2293_12570 [Elusimicrobia bacterium RIFOXYB2_FULL_49_7]
MKKDFKKICAEIANIRHAYNNLFNTIHGYAELALECSKTKKGKEYEFFVKKLLAFIPKKTNSARKLSLRLSVIQKEIQITR